MDNKNRRDHPITRSCIHNNTIMAVQVQLAFLLAIIALVHSAIIPLNKVEQSLPISIYNDEITVNLDKFVDNILPSVRKFILEHGMDPIELVNLSEHLFPHLPGKLKGDIELQRGWMQNLSLLKRSGHVIGTYKDKVLKLDMNFALDVADFNYEYHLKYLLYKRQGDMYGSLHDLKVNVVVTVDLANYHLNLDSLAFTEAGKCDIKFEGNILDRILNIVTKIVTVIFRKPVLRHVEERALIIFRAKIDEWNNMIH